MVIKNNNDIFFAITRIGSMLYFINIKQCYAFVDIAYTVQPLQKDSNTDGTLRVKKIK